VYNADLSQPTSGDSLRDGDTEVMTITVNARPDIAVLTRNGSGRFERSVPGAERVAEALSMRARSMTYQQIGSALGVSRQSAWELVNRAMAETITEPAEIARRIELDKLDALERRVHESLERRHFVISSGKIVSHDGEPLTDDRFLLTAVDRLLRISESRRELLGLDAPRPVAEAVEFRYEVVGVDMSKM
jgi:hypothetical protein